MRGKIDRSHPEVKNPESGQAVIEYVLLIAIIVGFYFLVDRVIRGGNLAKTITAPVKQDFARAYRYGHPKAKGPDDGGPELHPRFEDGNNFRLYLNPR